MYNMEKLQSITTWGSFLSISKASLKELAEEFLSKIGVPVEIKIDLETDNGVLFSIDNSFFDNKPEMKNIFDVYFEDVEDLNYGGKLMEYLFHQHANVQPLIETHDSNKLYSGYGEGDVLMIMFYSLPGENEVRNHLLLNSINLYGKSKADAEIFNKKMDSYRAELDDLASFFDIENKDTNYLRVKVKKKAKKLLKVKSSKVDWKKGKISIEGDGYDFNVDLGLMT